MAAAKRNLLAGTVAAAAALVALALAPALAGTASGAATTGGCTATAHIDSQWGGGQVVTITVVNTAPAAATSWSVTWTAADGQRVASAWNATVSTAGSTVTAVNAAWNGALAPGASTTFGLQLAGNGPAPVPACTDDAAPPTSAPPGADVTVTTADNGATITLVTGQTLEVSLPANYRPPAANAAVLTPLSSSGGYPTGRPLLTRYRAAAPGTTDVYTQTDDPCFYATPPCARPVAIWLLHVRVVPAPSGGAGRTVTA